MKHSQQEINDLIKDNDSLKDQLNKLKEQQKKSRGRFIWVIKKGGTLWAGPRLEKSFYKLYSELPTVTKSTFAEFSANIFKRLLRIGFAALLLAAIPLLLLLLQTLILSKSNNIVESQNQKIELQNEILSNQSNIIESQNSKLQIQIELQEASRRSNLVLLMDNILNRVNNELTDEKNDNQTISKPLISRIKSLSQGFLPYRFYDYRKDSLDSKLVSPERGQLLSALVNSGINNSSLDNLYDGSTFARAYLYGVDLNSSYLKNVNLNSAILTYASLIDSDLRDATLWFSNLEGADLNNADLRGVNLVDADLPGTSLIKADLRDANLGGADLQRANLQFANLKDAIVWSVNFRNSDLRYANLSGVNFNRVSLSASKDLNYVKVGRPDWFAFVSDSSRVFNSFGISEQYRIELVRHSSLPGKYKVGYFRSEIYYMDLDFLVPDANGDTLIYTLVDKKLSLEEVYKDHQIDKFLSLP